MIYENFEIEEDYKELKIGVVGTENFTKKFSLKSANKNWKTIDLSFWMLLL